MASTADESGELVARLKGGDQQALAELFSRHRQRLWRMVHFRLDPRLQGRVDANDILQEGYLAAAGAAFPGIDQQRSRRGAGDPAEGRQHSLGSRDWASQGNPLPLARIY